MRQVHRGQRPQRGDKGWELVKLAPPHQQFRHALHLLRGRRELEGREGVGGGRVHAKARDRRDRRCLQAERLVGQGPHLEQPGLLAVEQPPEVGEHVGEPPRKHVGRGARGREGVARAVEVCEVSQSGELGGKGLQHVVADVEPRQLRAPLERRGQRGEAVGRDRQVGERPQLAHLDGEGAELLLVEAERPRAPCLLQELEVPKRDVDAPPVDLGGGHLHLVGVQLEQHPVVAHHAQRGGDARHPVAEGAHAGEAPGGADGLWEGHEMVALHVEHHQLRELLHHVVGEARDAVARERQHREPRDEDHVGGHRREVPVRQVEAEGLSRGVQLLEVPHDGCKVRVELWAGEEDRVRVECERLEGP
mmetsp:Transcript_35234/g.90039  ORF Transcript_35234/g.90039 Transcript_35234/m.90039 type:complete len:363 (-) Transcript_35234:484-1572(-)